MDKPNLRDVLSSGDWRKVGSAHWVSRNGEVFSEHKGRLLKCPPTTDGYPTVHHEGRTRYVHDLVLTAWVGPRPQGGVARHLNDIPDDNRVENLRWGTRAQNVADGIRNGRAYGARGSDHPKALLTERQVREIRAFRTYGFKIKEIAEWYGISVPGAAGIIRGRNWRHVK